MKQWPDPSDEEIISYMDFDTLRKKQLEFAARKRNRYTILKWLVPALMLLSLGAWYYGFNESKVEAPETFQKAEVQANQLPKPSETVAPVKDSTLLKVTEDVNMGKPIKHEIVKPKYPEVKPTAVNTNVIENTTSVESIYIQAEPMEGYAALYTFLNVNLQYPRESVKDSTQGVQTISFIINVEGKPENIQFVESLGIPFEKESRRLIESMPLWKPAKLNGKPVASKLVLPITFQIQTVKAEN